MSAPINKVKFDDHINASEYINASAPFIDTSMWNTGPSKYVDMPDNSAIEKYDLELISDMIIVQKDYFNGGMVVTARMDDSVINKLFSESAFESMNQHQFQEIQVDLMTDLFRQKIKDSIHTRDSVRKRVKEMKELFEEEWNS